MWSQIVPQSQIEASHKSCRHTVACTPGRENARSSFFSGDWACEIELNQAVDHVVCLKAEFQMHIVLSNENRKFYTSMIYLCFSRSVSFSMGSPAWLRFNLCASQSSLVSRWRDAPPVREFQMWRRRCKQIDPHWFQGRQMRIWWMWSTISSNIS